MSQLLDRLHRDLNSSTVPVERAEISARIAGNLARLGRFSEARALVTAVREQFGQGQSGRVTVWLMLAEALIHHYEELSPAALDRIRGAQVLAQAMGYSVVIGLSAAWKAHIEFERSDFPAMVESLVVAFGHVRPEDLDARVRIAAVLSNSFMVAGHPEQGRYWYRRGHDLAVRNGDQASIDALLYNHAAFQLSRLRVLNCIETLGSEQLASVKMEIASARNLQQLLRVAALGAHVRLLEARLLMLESKFDQAIAQLQSTRSEGPFAEHNFNQQLIELEIRFCQLMLGQSEVALENLPTLEPQQFAELDIDERIVAAWMCTKLAQADARFGSPETFVAETHLLWQQYSEDCGTLLKMLERFSAGEDALLLQSSPK